MSVTLKDIAEKAKVSVSTVSRIINNDSGNAASKKTREKVWQIVRELGYIPNQDARNLIKGKTNKNVRKGKTIACIFTSTKNTYDDPFYSQIAKGVQIEAARRGNINLILFSVCGMSNSSLFNNINVGRVDGAIILGRFSEDFLRFLKTNIPNLVYSGVNYVDEGIDEIICDSFKGIGCAIDHLIANGHSKIGYIGHIPGADNSDIFNERRFDGYRYAMKKYNLEIQQNYINNTELTIAGGYKSMKSILENGDLPTAICCANDRIAVGVMKAAHENQIKIPQKIAVVGFDDLEISSYTQPSLTTIRVPMIELGQMAVKILIDRIEEGHALPLRIDLPFKLIVRESCGGFK
jgi:DNA-binding LacI/PurR family transcriptional regulator